MPPQDVAPSTIDDEAIRQEAIRRGMQPLRISGLQLLVKKGITTLEEIAAVTMEDEE
jgi:type II secretory ATPase GspE/PulE/Tfp pilus assembly ATPase PilB-like protein